MERRRFLRLFGGVDPRIAALLASWQSRVATAGGTLSATDLSAGAAFLSSVLSLGMTDANARVNLFAGDQLAAALVPILRGGGQDAETNVNFVGGDYSRATGLTGNGSTKYIDTGTVPATATGHMSAYLRATLNTSNAVVIGCQNAGATEIYALRKGGSTATRGYWGGVANATVTETMIGGHYVVSRTAGPSLKAYRAGAAIASTTSAGGSGLTETAHVFASNNGGTAGAFISGTVPLGGYSQGSLELDDAQAAAYSAAWQSAMTALGRAV